MEHDNLDDLLKKLATLYADNPLFKDAKTITKTALLVTGTANPEIASLGIILSGIDEILGNRLGPIVQKRKIAYLYDLAVYGINAEQLESEEELHKFLLGYFTASKTYTEQKIKRIARLVSGSIKEKMNVAIFEEYLAILSSITEIQLQVLLLLQDYETKYYLDKKAYQEWVKENEKVEEKEHLFRSAMVDKFWENFEKTAQAKFKLTLDELYFILQKASNLGLYLAFGKAGFSATPRNLYLRGRTTSIFADFVKWVQDQDEALNHLM
ncbi:MAG: hypothetical protein L0154_05860 [Chloroflexi bacterium]|nr:hypothetical protein [Chloroflexota bacterium]